MRDSPVDVVTEGLLSIVQGVKRCLRDGLKQKEEGFTQISPKQGQQTFWPFVQGVTPEANLDYILEQVAEINPEKDDVELMEVAWILHAINDGTLADYIQLCLETPLSKRASWYTQDENTVMLDDAKLGVLKEAAQQICDIYFQIDLKDLWGALKEDERVKEMTLGDGLLAPAPSPVLVGRHPERQECKCDECRSLGSEKSILSETPELRRYSEGAQVQEIDKETLRREAEDLDQVMAPKGRSIQDGRSFH